MTEIPAFVAVRVSGALAVLCQTRDSLEQGRTADRMFEGRGRYEADAWMNTAKHLPSALAALEDFMARAAVKGIDGKAVIAALGGMPDLTLSPQALEWLQPKGDANHV